MKTTLIFCLLGLWSVLGLASETDRGSFNYSGSRGNQNMSLQTETMRTEYRWVQVPYQERVCRTETRYRRECRQEPPRRQCRQEPPRRQCRMVNKPVCRVVNGRRVCRDRQVRVCRDIPGRRVCRNVPGRRVCRDVPYQERVCRMETRYRQERRAYQVVDRRTNANLMFNFVVNGSSVGVNTRVDASLDRDFLSLRTEDLSSPQRALLYKMRESRGGTGRDVSISRNYEVTVADSEKLFRPINTNIMTSEINGGVIEFEIGKVFQPIDTRFRLRVVSGSVLIDRVLNPGEYSLRDGITSKVNINLRTLLGGDYSGRELDIEFTVSVPKEKLLNAQQFSRFTNSQQSRRLWR